MLRLYRGKPRFQRAKPLKLMRIGRSVLRPYIRATITTLQRPYLRT